MYKKRTILLLAMILVAYFARAEYVLDYGAEFIGNSGTGNFAPFHIMSNNHGVQTQPKGALLKLDLHRDINKEKRFSYGYGVTIIGGYSSKTGYQAYDLESSSMKTHYESSAMAWIQQLYAELKYRSLFLMVGMKEDCSNLLNERLSSGDLTLSSNARPRPGISTGFIEPQDIPFTKGWVQIAGEIGFYKFTDDKWLKNHYNYRNSFITTDLWFNYKYCYFSTKPSKPFSFTLGMQATCQFGGLKTPYVNGVAQEDKVINMKPTFGTVVRTIIPGSGGTNPGDINYVEGNHVGSWDLMGRYRFNNGTILKAYYQSPFDDGSGIGKLNGFDGLYGIEYKSAKDKGVVTGAVIEYLDFTNQGGPIHWSPDDYPGTVIDTPAEGADNYYNNYTYNGYQYYGMSLGSPVIKSPIYNTDGFMAFNDTRLRCIHVGLEGSPWNHVSYRVLLSYMKSWGTIFRPHSVLKENTSAMVECVYDWKNIPGLKVKGQLGLDRGTLYGNNFGVMLSVSYQGLLKL